MLWMKIDGEGSDRVVRFQMLSHDESLQPCRVESALSVHKRANLPNISYGVHVNTIDRAAGSISVLRLSFCSANVGEETEARCAQKRRLQF